MRSSCGIRRAADSWRGVRLARAFSPHVCGAAVPGALPQARVARAFSPRMCGVVAPGPSAQARIARVFSPRVCGAAVHGATPHAGIGRAVGAFNTVVGWAGCGTRERVPFRS